MLRGILGKGERMKICAEQDQGRAVEGEAEATRDMVVILVSLQTSERDHPLPDMESNVDHTAESHDEQRQDLIQRSSPRSLQSTFLGHSLARERESHDNHGRLGRARTHRRSRSGSESVASEGLDVIAGDEIILEQRHTNDPTESDDYDWYDDNGMRVRVREI